MKDQVERFEQYWEEAISSIEYRLFMSAERTSVVEQRKVNEIVKNEIWTSRFSSAGVIRHGAAVFIDDLKRENPEIGNRVENRLANLTVNAGVNLSFLIGTGLSAALFLLLWIISIFAIVPMALKLLFGLVFIVSAICTFILFQKNTAARKTLQFQLNGEKDEILKILRRMDI